MDKISKKEVEKIYLKIKQDLKKDIKKVEHLIEKNKFYYPVNLENELLKRICAHKKFKNLYFANLSFSHNDNYNITRIYDALSNFEYLAINSINFVRINKKKKSVTVYHKYYGSTKSKYELERFIDFLNFHYWVLLKDFQNGNSEYVLTEVNFTKFYTLLYWSNEKTDKIIKAITLADKLKFQEYKKEKYVYEGKIIWEIVERLKLKNTSEHYNSNLIIENLKN